MCLENDALLRHMKRQSAAGGGSDELVGLKAKSGKWDVRKRHEHRSGWAWWNYAPKA